MAKVAKSFFSCRRFERGFGANDSIIDQVLIQGQTVLITIIWSGVVSLIAYKLVDLLIGMRVPVEEEREGLDISSHGESAYHG